MRKHRWRHGIVVELWHTYLEFFRLQVCNTIRTRSVGLATWSASRKHVQKPFPLKEKSAIGGGTAAKLAPPTAHYASRAPRSSESIVTCKTYPKLSVWNPIAFSGDHFSCTLRERPEMKLKQYRAADVHLYWNPYYNRIFWNTMRFWSFFESVGP